MTIYVDLDGVLADFDKAAEKAMNTDNIYKYEFVWGKTKFWEKINANPDFFAELPVKDDAWDLMEAITQLEPTILTALPSSNAEKVDAQKRGWVDMWFGDYPVITCLTKDKPNYCEPGDILIDDRAINRGVWLAKGGIYIIHTTAERTVAALQALGIIP